MNGEKKDLVYHFPPFWLDEGAARLWEGGEHRPLRRKTFALLHYLVTHAGQLASKDDLLAEGWPDVTVNEIALAVCIHELRQVFGDDAEAPRFIETAHGSGYRFVAPVTISHGHADAQRRSAPRINAPQVVVGRERDLSLLLEAWKLALEGARQVIFVGGEPGIGKTALVDHFLSIVAQSGPVLIGRGQCVEQYGEGEAYLPILEALGRMCHGAGGGEMRDVLRRLAPSWFAQMPGIVDATEAQAIQLQAARSTGPRMLREMAEALEFIAATRPVIVVCEDLHAGDRSTVELIDYLARRRGAADDSRDPPR